MRTSGLALKTNIAPKNWGELLELLGLEKGRRILCLDEFPYLVASDPVAAQRDCNAGWITSGQIVHAGPGGIECPRDE